MALGRIDLKLTLHALDEDLAELPMDSQFCHALEVLDVLGNLVVLPLQDFFDDFKVLRVDTLALINDVDEQSAIFDPHERLNDALSLAEVDSV